MAVNISLEGIGDLLNDIELMGQNVSRVENEALKAAAEPVLKDAKATTQFHDRTGKLRDGLSISNVKKQNGSKYVLVGIDKSDTSKIYYGKFLEFGTTKMPARPFLQPALEKNKENIQSIIHEKLTEALK